MEDQCLRCNNRAGKGGICRTELKESAIVTTCSHVLCKECAENTGFTGTQSKNRQCPVCTQPLPNVDDAAEVRLQPTEEYKTSVLCGLDPTTIMECASSALSFWNYQMLQETAYQQHLLLALSKRYSHLNNDVNKIVDEANHEINGLHSKIEGMSETNAKLQQKNNALADNCQERGKKYNELRKGYEALKKIVQKTQQNGINEESARQAVRSFTANPVSETLDGVIRGRLFNNDAAPTQPTALHNLYGANDSGSNEQIHHCQRPRSGSQYSGEASKMPPLRRPHSGLGISPMNAPPQHRTPLPGMFRATADRSQPSANASRRSHQNDFIPPGSGHRHYLRTNGPHNASHSRHNSVGGYGGISAGMKVGGAIIDPHSGDQSGYVPSRVHIHRPNDTMPNAGSYF